MNQPLSSAALIGLGLALTTMSAATRWLWNGTRSRRIDSWTDFGFHVLTTGNLLMIGATLSIPGSSGAGWLVFWCLLVSEELLAAIGYARLRQARRGFGFMHAPTVSAPAGEPTATANTLAINSLRSERSSLMLDDECDNLPPELVQQITWTRDEQGGLSIEGVIRSDFQTGQRQQNVHLAFCPPLTHPPRLSVSLLDATDADVKPVQVETFGAAIEIRFRHPSATPTSVLLHFSTVES